MSNFKFTPKRGVIANVTQFVRSTSATAALTAANGLAVVQFVNKAVTDGLKLMDVAEEMAMSNASEFFSEQLGEEITITDIREGNINVEEASKERRLLAAKRGQLRIAKEKIKIQEQIEELNRKIDALKEQR